MSLILFVVIAVTAWVPARVIAAPIARVIESAL